VTLTNKIINLEDSAMHTAEKFASVILSALIVLAMGAFASFAATKFEGTWSVKDSAGKTFQITLAADGSAKADREGEGMTGTWKQEGSAAVIQWNTGWITKISEQGGSYTKTAFKKGEAPNGKPTNSSTAEKVK
jgi:hypothetical protein